MSYRLTLSREWATLGHRGTVNWIMLNPSTATDTVDDATIRKCIGFSKRWGFNRLAVTNLFAFRATNPAELKVLSRVCAIGEGNDKVILTTAADADVIVCAWGNLGHWMGRDREVVEVLAGRDLHCVGQTNDGSPRHPGRVGYTDAPLLWRPAAPEYFDDCVATQIEEARAAAV